MFAVFTVDKYRRICAAKPKRMARLDKPFIHSIARLIKIQIYKKCNS